MIISDNTLEHTLCPFAELKKLRSKLKPGGKKCFVVPHEKKSPWKLNDINQHLLLGTSYPLEICLLELGLKWRR